MTSVIPPPGVRVREPGRAAGHPVVGALSPSRANDFLQCPLLYRFRAIDRLPERPGLAAFRGTLVHEVLDRLFDLEAPTRDVERATRIAPAALRDLLDSEPDAAFALVEDAQWPGPPPQVPDTAIDALLAQARALLGTYFAMEDPRVVVPVQREALLETELADGFVLRGYVDRLDRTHAGLRVVDYKTGRSPGQLWEQAALFQLRFYAVIVHLATGESPTMLQLLYLGNGEVLTYHPDAEDLHRFERKLRALWTAITRAADTGDWRAKPSAKCKWCCHQQICPAWGGTPPPLPEPQQSPCLTVEA